MNGNTMATEEKYSSYFGFTEVEVDDLFERYQKLTPAGQNVTREGLRTWYNGYHTQTGDDGIILELKVDHTAEEALEQIRDKNYQMKFQGKLGEAAPYTDRILAVGIGYDKKDKIHNCKVEILRERLCR